MKKIAVISREEAREQAIVCELASEIVERQWNKTHWENEPHSFVDTNGDIRYVDEAQDEFNEVLDVINNILNGVN